jgi:hypothetical protein
MYKRIKWTSLIAVFILFGYRIYLASYSSELDEKYYEGSGVYYDSSNKGILISIVIVLLVVVFAIFNALDAKGNAKK